MSIVDGNPSARRSRISKWEGLAAGTVVAAAVFAATPKLVHAEIDMQVTSASETPPIIIYGPIWWFNTSNWNQNGVTGTLPESYTTAPAAINIDADNSIMPAIGLLFDPANDPNTPGGPHAAYTANLDNISGSLYISSVTGT